MRILSCFVFLASLVLWGCTARAAEVRVVCVEAAWCDIVRQIGGAAVRTQALLTTPGIDPHEVTATPSMARDLAGASIVVLNGGTYDDWALPLVGRETRVLNVAALTGWTSGDNPHFFLDLRAVRRFAHTLTALLKEQDPGDSQAFSVGLNCFDADIDALEKQLAQMKQHWQNTPFAAIEPAGATLLARAGLRLVDADFAQSVMRHVESAPKDLAVLETVLSKHAVRFLVLNPAIESPQIDQIVQQAQAAHVPLVKIGETLPPGQSWQDWITAILMDVQAALNAPH